MATGRQHSKPNWLLIKRSDNGCKTSKLDDLSVVSGRTMESANRAGIASVVMRGKEYLIAIIAKDGILRAETLRFLDELRQPRDIGLPELDDAAPNKQKKFAAAIKKLSRKTWKKSDLDDQANAQMMALIARKLKAGNDVIEATESTTEADSDDNVVDLMAVLKQRLKGD